MPDTLAPIIDATTVERVLLHGDLKQLTSSQKVSYYKAVCDSVGLNPLTQPFQYLVLNGREILYARREATEQLRQIHQVSIAIVGRELVDDIYVVTARATLPSGRTDENIGAVSLGGLKGEARAINMMKAETKAKRRATLAICGLGMLDETEVASIPPEAIGAPAVALPKPREHERNRALKRHEQPAQPPEAPYEAPPLEMPIAGFVRVLRVQSAPTKKAGVTRYRITLSTGEEVTTINDWLASLAQECIEKQTPVKAETRQSQWGTDLVALKPATVPDLPLEPPPLDSDIPF